MPSDKERAKALVDKLIDTEVIPPKTREKIEEMQKAAKERRGLVGESNQSSSSSSG